MNWIWPTLPAQFRNDSCVYAFIHNLFTILSWFEHKFTILLLQNVYKEAIILKKQLINTIIKIVITVLVVAGVGYGGYYGYNKVSSAKATNTVSREVTVEVVRGDLTVNISGTGTVQPISRYDILPMVTGNIVSAPFEEGMEVKAGDLLYKIDDSDVSINIEKTKNSIAKFHLNNKTTLENIKNLEVFAPVDGRIVNFTVKVGDSVGSSNKIADIVNNERLVVKLPFKESDLEKISNHQSVQLVAAESSTKDILNGKVISKNSGIAEIEVDDPNVTLQGTKVVGVIETSQGNIVSTGAGIIEYAGSQALKIEDISGTVKKIYVNNNEWVKAGQKILELENDTLLLDQDKSALDLKDLQLTLESQLKQLENYNIVSPIDGVVITKNAKAGDTINKQDNTVLMTVADMSKMVFTMAVDELDISKVKLGQQAKVQADALPGKSFDGRVTNIAAEGTAQNGVTTYNVEVTIDNPGELKPGMNVNADIFVDKKENVLYLPMSAIQTIKGETYVFVKGNNSTNTTGNNERSDSQKQKQAAAGQNAQTARQPQAAAKGTGTLANLNGIRKKVVVGINNDEYIEIVSGLEEGEKVLLPYTPSQSSNRAMPGPGGFNMMGGGGAIPRRQ